MSEANPVITEESKEKPIENLVKPEANVLTTDENKDRPAIPPTQSNDQPDANLAPQQPSELHEFHLIPPKEEFIAPASNEAYHEKILSLLKITNNKTLNGIYNKLVPQISKSSLLLLDLTLAPSDPKIKEFEDVVLPECLMKDLPSKDPKMHYYQEFCQLTIANMVMQTQIKKLLLERQDIWQRMMRIQNRKKEEEAKGNRQESESVTSQPLAVFQVPLQPSIQASLFMHKSKRHRRTANEIERHYRCPVERCGKSYGSEGSLNQHIKLKHPELVYTTQIRPDTPSQIPPAVGDQPIQNNESSEPKPTNCPN